MANKDSDSSRSSVARARSGKKKRGLLLVLLVLLVLMIVGLVIGLVSWVGDDDPPPAAQIDSLTGTSTKVTLDTGFVKALKSLKVTPGPVGDATISKAGVASFPITGGNLVYYTPGSVTPYVQGLVNHDGAGLSLEAGGKTVELENFDVDPGESLLAGDVSVDGEEAASDTPLFFLDGRTLKPLRKNADGSKAVLEGATVTLKKEAADLLNKTFGIEALKPGLVIGTAKITVRTGA